MRARLRKGQRHHRLLSWSFGRFRQVQIQLLPKIASVLECTIISRYWTNGAVSGTQQAPRPTFDLRQAANPNLLRAAKEENSLGHGCHADILESTTASHQRIPNNDLLWSALGGTRAETTIRTAYARSAFCQPTFSQTVSWELLQFVSISQLRTETLGFFS